MLIIIFFATAAAKLIVSIICTQLNLGHLAPCSWEPVVISLNCLLLNNLGHLAPCSWEPVVISLNYLLLNMNSTNETLSFDRFLIMYNLGVFTCIIFIFVFHCTHVRMSYVLNSYLLTYWLSALLANKRVYIHLSLVIDVNLRFFLNVCPEFMFLLIL